MPTYKVTDPQTGKTLSLTGDSPPTEQELNDIFLQYKPQTKETSTPTSKDKISALGMAGAYGKGVYEGFPKAIRQAVMLPGAAVIAPLMGKKPGELAQQIEQGTTQAVAQAPEYKGTAGQVAKAVGGLVPFSQLSTPFFAGARLIPKIPAVGKMALGLGGYEATRAALEGQNIPEAGIKGAGTGLAYGIAGKAGATLAQRARLPFTNIKMPLNIAKRVGSGLAMGGLGYATAPEGEKASAGVFGAGLGLLQPSEPFKKPQKLANEIIKNYVGLKGDNGDKIASSVAKEGIVAKDAKSYYAKLKTRTGELMDTLTKSYDNATQQGVSVPLDNAKIIKPLIDLQNELLNYPDLNKSAINYVASAIGNINARFNELGGLTPNDVYKFKQELGKNINWKNTPMDLPIQSRKNITAKMKQVYSVIDKAVDSVVPGTADLNDRVSNLINASEMLNAKIQKQPGLLKKLRALDITRPATLLTPPFESTAFATGATRLLGNKYKK